jgi:hypothetical protein
MVIYKINHRFQSEILVPWCSIGRNIQFGEEQKGQSVQLSDGSQAEVISVNEIHILSHEADMLSHRLYGIPAITLLTEWYKRNPCITDLFFCNIKLAQFVKPATPADNPDTDAAPISE